jgi:hypothetical protein
MTSKEQTKKGSKKVLKKLTKKVPKSTKTVVDVVVPTSTTDKPVKTAKTAKTTKAAKAVKTEPRKFNNKPVLAKLTGLNISPAKVKNVISNCVLNKDAYTTIKELKEAQARTITTVVDGVSTDTDFAGTRISELSEPTRLYIDKAVSEYKKQQKTDYVKKKLVSLSASDKLKYNAAKTHAKSLLTNSEFDLETFNKEYSPTFYKDYDDAKSTSTSDEWKQAIDKVSKLKNRFSTHSRILLSAFVENLIKQLVLNGIYCCIADKKKIIQLSHTLNTDVEGFEKRFPLYPLVTTLKTFKQASLYLADNAKYVNSLPEHADSETPVKVSKVTDLFFLDNKIIDKNQFRYYISQSCREVRMDLALSEKDSDGNPMTIYNYTSVSKAFKNFCSALVCEFLTKIGQMLQKEIDSRGIKTVNDSIIRTVISHYHIVCGIDEKPSFEFIDTVSTKYNNYIHNRQDERKKSKSDTVSGDLEYVEE